VGQEPPWHRAVLGQEHPSGAVDVHADIAAMNAMPGMNLLHDDVRRAQAPDHTAELKPAKVGLELEQAAVGSEEAAGDDDRRAASRCGAKAPYFLRRPVVLAGDLPEAAAREARSRHHRRGIMRRNAVTSQSASTAVIMMLPAVPQKRPGELFEVRDNPMACAMRDATNVMPQTWSKVRFAPSISAMRRSASIGRTHSTAL